MFDMYLKIANIGEIDEGAFTLLGASTKRDDDTKIGFFGSGLKYALAVLTRNKIDFKIYSGLKEIKVTTKEEKFRDQSFNKIYINGKPTSLTAEMGIDWKPWFAIREIYCNAIDEGVAGKEVVSKENVKPIKGETIFYIELNEAFRDLTGDWKRYFSEGKEILHEGNGCRILKKHSDVSILYRRGVQCHEVIQNGSIYDYNSTKFEINESRTLVDSYSAENHITVSLMKCDDTNIVMSLINAFHASASANIDDPYEKKLSWEYMRPDNFSDTWLDCLKDSVIVVEEFAGSFLEEMTVKDVILPQSLVKALTKAFPKKLRQRGLLDGSFLTVEISETQNGMLVSAVDLITRGIGEINAPIHVCRFKDSNQLGATQYGKVYISEKLFDMGPRNLTLVILEEICHINSDAGDKTRQFQTYLLGMVIDQISEKLGVAI